jgi:hypothetical protein
MKLVVNKCFGGYSISPLAVKRYAELIGKECHFFRLKFNSEGGGREKITAEEASSDIMMMWTAFTVPDPEKYLPKENIGEDGTYKAYNEAYEKIQLDNRISDRADKFLVQTVEELGEKANGGFAKLEIVEIPDGTDWRIDEYDGMETVAEGRTW